MNYYNPGRRSLISDIMSPVSDGGYNVEHLRIQKQPIGSLDKRYQRRYAYKQPPAKPSASAPARHFTMVPPLATLRQDELSGTKFDKLHGTLAALGLATLTAWRNFRDWLGGVFAFIRPQSNAFRYAALPVLLVVFGVLWLLHADTPSANGSHSIPIVGQLIPVTNSAKADSRTGKNNNDKNKKDKNGGSGSSAQTAGSMSGGSPQSLQGASYLPSSGYAAGGSAPSTGNGLVGGMGGVSGGGGSSLPTGSTSTPSTGSTGGGSGSGSTGGVLPLTLTVPPVNTSTPDGKTLLNSSGTTLQVN